MKVNKNLRFLIFTSIISFLLIVAIYKHSSIKAAIADFSNNTEYAKAKRRHHFSTLFNNRKQEHTDLNSSGGLTNIKVKQEDLYKYGYKNKNQDIVIAPVFDSPATFQGAYAVNQLDGKYGVIDREGKVIVPFQFDNIKLFDEGKEYAIISQNNKKAIIDFEKNKLVTPRFDDLQLFNIDLDYFIATRNGKQGIVDIRGKTIILLENESITIAENKNYAILKKTFKDEFYKTKSAIINLEGNIITPFDFQIIAKTQDILWGKRDDQMGFINQQGRFVALKMGNGNDYFAQGIAKLRFPDENYFSGYRDYSDFYCVVNQQGNLLVSAKSSIPDKQEKINNLCRSLAGIKVDNDPDDLLKKSLQSTSKGGNISQHNRNSAAETPYERFFSEGLVPVLINYKYGYMNLKGELAIAPQFDTAGDFSEGLAAVIKDKKHGFINRKGEIKIYLDKEIISSDFYRTCDEHTKKCLIIPHQLSKFKNGLAKVTRVNYWQKSIRLGCSVYSRVPKGFAYVDKSGKIVKYQPIKVEIPKVVNSEYLQVCDPNTP